MKNLTERKKQEVKFQLPWPPSVNQAYRAYRGRVVKSVIAKKYFHDVSWSIVEKKLPRFGKQLLKVLVVCYPPDNRQKRDLGNLDKVLMDTLENSGLFEDDSQICDVRYVRRPPVPPGHVEITIEAIDRI